MINKINILDFNNYQTYIKNYITKSYSLAKRARQKNLDPKRDIEIPIAEDLAARVEGLVSVLYPSLIGSGLSDRIREYEKKYGKNDFKVSLYIAKDIALGDMDLVKSREEKLDLAVRVAVAYLTLGVVTAPLEGISHVKIKRNEDNTEYAAIYYTGPIRSAGGTASAMSVIVTDFVRRLLNLDEYKPTTNEINRYYTEVEDYYTRIAPKQYHPSKEEMDFLIEHVPVEITGEPTEKLEVSNYKDLDRVETNRIRGGMCLVLLDGLPLKAEKLLKFIKKEGKRFGLEDWLWLEEFIELKRRINAALPSQNQNKEKREEESRYIPNKKYLSKLVAGRPVLSFPSQPGGFRLRYGKSFTNGLAATNLSPGAFYLLEFLAIGTQVAIEAPGKASVLTPNHTLLNPLVLLDDGSVVEISTKEEADKYRKRIKKILFLGDVLIPFGEFLANNHVLLPSGYVEEWWLKELEEKDEELKEKYKEYWHHYPSFEEAVEISKKHSIPLHPRYLFFFSLLSPSYYPPLIELLSNAKQDKEKLIIPYNPQNEENKKAKKALELLGVRHIMEGSNIIINEDRHIYNLLASPTPQTKQKIIEKIQEGIEKGKEIEKIISELVGVEIRRKAGAFIGMKMGRPEKAGIRTMKVSPQVLFPAGLEGGRTRNLMESYNKGYVTAEISHYKCLDCSGTSYFPKCMNCGSDNTKLVVYCDGKEIENGKGCAGNKQSYKEERINIRELLDKAYSNLSLSPLNLVKGVKKLMGEHKIPERLEKGLLRAKYGLYVNKDGTIRFDAIDLPMTHFRPKDIGVRVEKLRELGYEKDIYGEELTREDQILLLYPQDIIIPESEEASAADVLIKAANFVDELLTKVYGLEPFYNIKTKEDLIGHLVIGLAPHTSAGIIGRIIGFGRAKALFAHPFWHAAKRRNCDGDEDSILLLMDALLNFSREYLPHTRGAKTMDAPLVLTTILDPEEIDDEAWNIEVHDGYSKEFYEATQHYKYIYELEDNEKPKTVGDIIHEDKYKAFYTSFTHPSHNPFDAPIKTKYVKLTAMIDKVKEQLELAEKIQAVDENKVAEEILNKHLMKDIKGNLRTFSKQAFRCIDCNEKYRRVPLKGKCTKCGGKLVLTVSEGTVRKYVEVVKDIINKYKVSSYTLQQFEILEESIESMFGKKTKQINLFSLSSNTSNNKNSTLTP